MQKNIQVSGIWLAASRSAVHGTVFNPVTLLPVLNLELEWSLVSMAFVLLVQLPATPYHHICTA